MPHEIIELPVEPAAAAGPSKPTAAAAEPRRVKLYVATPCYSCQMTPAYLAGALSLHIECARRGVECVFDFLGNESLVERARNVLAARFLKTDFTHLLFIDADIGFRPDTVFRLLEADKDVMTAVYPKKAHDWDLVAKKLKAGDQEPLHQMGLDFNINIKRSGEPIENGFARVLDSATGFMLIKRGVLEAMYQRYGQELACVNDIQGQDVKDYVAIFACMIDPENRRFLSEDYSFCRRYQDMGGEIWADLASPLAHVGSTWFSGDLRGRLQTLKTA